MASEFVRQAAWVFVGSGVAVAFGGYSLILPSTIWGLNALLFGMAVSVATIAVATAVILNGGEDYGE